MDIGFQGDTVRLNMTLAACLVGYGEVGLWSADESKHPGSWVIMDDWSNPYVAWIREYSGEIHQKGVEIGLGALLAYSPGFFLNVGEIAATIEGLDQQHPSRRRYSRSGPRFGGSALFWKGDFGIWRSHYPEVFEQCCRLSVST